MSSRWIVFAWAGLILAAALSPVGMAGDPSQRATDGPRYALVSQPTEGEIHRITAIMEVGGELKLAGQKKVDRLPMAVRAELKYDERLLGYDRNANQRRSIRYYDQMDATLKIDKRVEKPTLDEKNRLVVVDMNDGVTTLFCPQGRLTRDEFDLLSVLGNSLTLDALLPNRTVAQDEPWELDGQAMGGLLGVDAISQCDVTARLTDVADNVALVHLSGNIKGAAEGVATEIQIKAKFHFDLKTQRITAILLAVKEDRSIGHVGPGLDVIAKIKMLIQPAAESVQLDDKRVAALSTVPDAEKTRLQYESDKAGFRFLCDRRWFVTSDEKELVVLRMVDRGDLVAQCNVSPLIRRSAERRISLAQYQNDVKHSLGKNLDQILSAAQWTDAQGQLVYQVVAQGTIEELPIQWRYYLIAHPGGRRAALAFSVEGSLAERLGDEDRRLVDGFELAEPEVTAKPASVKVR